MVSSKLFPTSVQSGVAVKNVRVGGHAKIVPKLFPTSVQTGNGENVRVGGRSKKWEHFGNVK
jgi:hypothetical protein